MISAKSQMRPRFEKLTLTDAEIKALPSTDEGGTGGKILIPAVASVLLLPQFALLSLVRVADYTNLQDGSKLFIAVGDLQLSQLVDSAGASPSALTNITNLLAPGVSGSSTYIDQTVGQIATSPNGAYPTVSVSALSNSVNQPIYISSNNGPDFTGGNAGNSLTIYLHYWEVNV